VKLLENKEVPATGGARGLATGVELKAEATTAATFGRDKKNLPAAQEQNGNSTHTMNVLEASTEPTLGPNDKLAEPVKGEEPRQKPWKKFGFAALIILGGVVVAIHHSFVQAEVADPRLASPLVMVSVVQPEEGGVRSFTGIVAARVESDLGFRVGGKIAERLVDMGQTVRLGQPLMRLDDNDLMLALSAANNNVVAAKAHQVQAAADEARLRKTYQNGAVSVQAYDLAKATADSTDASLKAAEAQAMVAKNASEYAHLVADVDGVVVSTLAEPGQVVQPGQVVVKLAAAGPREAVINLPETLHPGIGTKAQAILYANQGKVFPARLRQLSDSADPITRTFEARYVMQGEAAHAPLGGTVTIQLSDDEHLDSIPIGALCDRGNGNGVWVLNQNDSTVSFQKVQVARLGEESAFLSNGLTVGEKIVALGAHLLQEGQKVRVEGQQGLGQ